jgi:dolichol-phosphate mannosyltransferase
MKVLIVIPTYNEAQNIERFVRSIMRVTEGCFRTDLLVVDDNSPDGTGDIVRELIRTAYHDTVFLLSRDCKRGLGTAYIQGFRWGLHRDYQAFVEMDADFSHNPDYLPQMIKKLEQVDYIVGSRYIPDGGIKGWGPFRRMLSKMGSLYAKTILDIPIHDLTGGFNAWRREVLENINLTEIKSEGYSFQIELKYRAFSKGFRYLELPILFEDRFQGKSKMSKKIILEAIYRVWQLKIKS